MRRRGGAGLWLGLLLWGATAWGATYYVSPSGSDGNAGSEGQPFRTVARGLQSLASGDTLYLRGGNYGEEINPTVGGIPNGGGSWATATTIAGYPGETAQIGRLNLGDGGGFAWMRFTNLTLPSVFLAGDTHHIRVDGSDIAYSPNHGIAGGGGFHEFVSNKIHDAYYYGTYWAGHDTLFENNDFYNNGGYAVHLYNTGATNVSENVIRNNRITGNGLRHNDQHSGGVILSHGTNNQAYNNLIDGNFAGVQVDYDCVECQVHDNTISNNLTYSIQVGRAVNTHIWGNTITGNGNDGIADTGSGTTTEPGAPPRPGTPESPGGGPAPRLPPRTTTTLAAGNP